MKESFIDVITNERPDSLDELVHRMVMGQEVDYSYYGNGTPAYSSDWRYAGPVLDKLEELVTRWTTADGFTILKCGHFAEHGECAPHILEQDDVAELDGEAWSFHIHLGLCGSDDSGMPKHWRSEDWFCARGATGPEAICRSVIKAFDPEFVRGREQTHERMLPIIQQRLKDYTESKHGQQE